MMDLLTRLGKAFRSRRASTVFSINNFNHVVTVSPTHCSCLLGSMLPCLYALCNL